MHVEIKCYCCHFPVHSKSFCQKNFRRHQRDLNPGFQIGSQVPYYLSYLVHCCKTGVVHMTYDAFPLEVRTKWSTCHIWILPCMHLTLHCHCSLKRQGFVINRRQTSPEKNLSLKYLLAEVGVELQLSDWEASALPTELTGTLITMARIASI